MIRTLMPFTSCKQLFTFLFSLFFSAITFSQTIVSENNLPGTPQSVWDVSGAGDLSIQGFATEISVNKGETVHFKIQTNANNYTIDIYRLGYYQATAHGYRVQQMQPLPFRKFSHLIYIMPLPAKRTAATGQSLPRGRCL